MNFFLTKKTIQYYICARHKYGHGIHSPFVYDFVRNVLRRKKKHAEFAVIEQRRKELRTQNSTIEVLDLGAGSVQLRTKQRAVSDIARTSLSPQKYARLLHTIISHYQSSTILELGTSLGVSAAYLALGNTQARCVTLEGAPAIAAIARETFAACNLDRIELIEGNFADTLPLVLEKLHHVDFAFIDGNHQQQATLDYFNTILPYCSEKTILVFDDICWSEGMYAAWQEICAHPQVSISVSLCKLGIVFLRKGIEKQNFTIRY
ncbi:MAG: class I SAM-dependent methyltransferase [Bacteroidales bacterium]|jgi:predicted O-methyltransferase YrrM|nr:class I SAM-dependent methyltransferase [Bacteroidales bacterium]